MAGQLYDAIIVGGGPAGLAAASWLGRYRRCVLVLDSGEYRSQWTETSHGYLGADPVDPAELLERGRREVHAYPTVELRRARVTELRREPDGPFVALLADGGEERACRLVLATGVRDVFPEVEGFYDHYGASVFHCPTCDGYEARDRHVVVLGWSAQVAGFALSLLDWAKEVTVVTDGRPFDGVEQHRSALERFGVRLVEDDAVSFVGRRGELSGVRLRGGETLRTEMVFFSIAHRPVHSLAQSLGCELTEEGCVAVDSNNETTVRGVYAAGDLTPGMQLLQVAAAKGAVAGVSCALSLQGEPGGDASPTPAPDPEAEINS